MSSSFRKDDPYRSKEWRNFTRSVINDMLPKMKESALVVGLSTASDEADCKMAVEIGFCLLLGKPLLIMAEKEGDVHPGLLRAADEVVYGEIQHPKNQQALHEAMDRMVPDLKEKS